MPESKFLKCSCAHCGGHIEFPADGIGATIPCPHCARETELTLDTPETESPAIARNRKWIIAGLVILVVGIVGVAGALVTARRLMAKARQRAAAAQSARSARPNAAARSAARAGQVLNDFSMSAVTLERKPDSSLVYAVGAIRNGTDKQRFGVTVEVDLLDQAGAKVGTAKDYRDVIEPRESWTFRASVLVPKNVAAARVTAIHER